jgi:adenine-specific DNA-methyltransferase
MTKKTRLELTWPGKENRPALEPRILIENPEMSYHAGAKADGDLFDNLLIKGDNLLALKSLEADYAGEVKCVFIDPPYNTGYAFEHYDDGLEHSLWLSLMRDRLECIHRLLSDEGSLWVTLDDNEAHYFKIICDEIFGRRNFISNAVWQKKYTVSNDAKWLSDNHDHVLIYAKSADLWRPQRLARSDEMNARYSNPDNHPKGPWKATPIHAKSGSSKAAKFSFTFKNGKVWSPPAGTFPRFSEETLRRFDEADEIWFGKDGTAGPAKKTFLGELKVEGPPSPTVWLHTEVGNNHEAREETKTFNSLDPFGTPKPERLLQRILHLATSPGDLVLDSFAGSGTTGAVAHKMGRRWIMVEIGDHADTHIVPRLCKVIEGTDQGGISKAVGWNGGGGFRYCTLAPSLLAKDAWGNWVIDKTYRPEMLAEAMCKHLGFRYAPSQDEGEWWRHGQSSETDFLYVTTQSLTHDALKLLSEAVGPDRTLLICARAFAGAIDQFPNLMAKKIPSAILSSCEWGRDDYSLNISNLPVREEETPDHGPLFATGETDHG